MPADERIATRDGKARKRPSRHSFPFQRRSAWAPEDAEAEDDAHPGFLKLDIDANHNQRVVFQEVRTRHRITRSELAAVTGLTKPTVVNVSRQLLHAGLVLETKQATFGRGQPAWMLELNPDGAYAAGLNIDRDHITLVALDLSGQLRGRVSIEISFASPEQARDCFIEAWRTLAGESNIALDRVVGLGIALPDELGTLAFPGKPAGYEVWALTDVVSLFETAFPGPIFVENDAVAAAIGESQFGHGLEAPTFVYVLISVLLGGGIVIDRTYFRGENGRSGEIGFMRVTTADGTIRALQDVVSLGALYERLKHHGIVTESPADLETLDRAGLAVVDKWLNEASGYLATIVSEVGRFIEPDAIMLGGRLPEPLLDRLAKACKQQRPETGTSRQIAIYRAKLSSDAPAIGAAILPFQTLLFPSLQMLERI